MSAGALSRLIAIVERLRDPETGCDWDRAQTFATIAPYTIEEVYEVADAIDRNDLADLKDELGDLLFAASAGLADLGSILSKVREEADDIHTKLRFGCYGGEMANGVHRAPYGEVDLDGVGEGRRR